MSVTPLKVDELRDAWYPNCNPLTLIVVKFLQDEGENHVLVCTVGQIALSECATGVAGKLSVVLHARKEKTTRLEAIHVFERQYSELSDGVRGF